MNTMSKYLSLVSTIVLFVSGMIMTARYDTVLDVCSSKYHNNLKTFNQSLNSFIKTAHLFESGETELENLQQSLIDCRLSYKSIEHFMEYFHREAVSKYINGAPLPKLETSAPGINIIKPNGLQTLDELVFSDEVKGSASQIAEMATKLSRTWKDLYIIESSRELQHRFIFESIRFQIWRIYSLGLTGFDTPGSVNAIDEARTSLSSLKSYMEYYQAFTYKRDAAEELSALQKTLSDFIVYLRNNSDFDTLDRMFILRNFVNPSYRQVYELQSALSIEFVDEVDPTARAVNYHSSKIFSDEFLSKGYFAQVSNEELEDSSRIALGKILFHDPVLSSDLSLSCASCHQPDKAFADGMAKSISNKEHVNLQRNVPSLINSVYAERYFYDLREYSLERQVKHVVYDKNEFDIDFVELADRLKQSDEYLALFKMAYGEKDRYGISPWSISNALACYVASLSSWNSPFDKYARGESQFIDNEVIKGYNLFMGKAACGTCHFAPVFNGTIPPNYLESESEVLGVPERPDTSHAKIDPDPGRIASGRAIDEAEHFLFAFKTTSVRNVELTAPYMHNGVYETLDDLLDFYNRGGGAGIGIYLSNQTLPPDPLDLNQDELNSIKAFLNSLTDTSGLTKPVENLPKFMNPKFANRVTY